MNSQFYAFYGSLRVGMVNHRHYKPYLKYLYTTVLPGYKMYALRDYPYVIKSGNVTDLIVAEIFEISEEKMRKEIHDLEIGAGYEWEEISTGDKSVVIYLFARAGNEMEVKGGDWVKFFGHK